MLNAFAENAAVRAAFDEASGALGQDLWKLAAEGPAEELNRTVNTQPLMLTAGTAIYRAWQAAGGPAPQLMAGHSLGEYTALVAAGAITFKDAVPLVRFRAQAMQDAVPLGAGAMAAILGLDDDAVRAACAEAAQGEVVEAVNFNAPGQVVIAGHKAAVERAAAVALKSGAKRALMLPVSAPFHASLLKPAADKLRAYLANIAITSPVVAVINNVDVAMVGDAAGIRDALSRQAASPVRWVETVRKMAGEGVTVVAECGPGRVLAGLTKRIEGSMRGLAITDPSSLEQALEAVR